MVYGQDILVQCLGKSPEQMAMILSSQRKLDVATAFINFLLHEKDKLAVEGPEYIKSRRALAHFLANPINEAALRDVSIPIGDEFGETRNGVPALNYAITILFNAISRIKIDSVNKDAVRVIIATLQYLSDIPFFSMEHAALMFARFKYGLDIRFIARAKKLAQFLSKRMV